MPSLAQVCIKPRNASRQSRPASLWVPPLILRLMTWQRMSRSEPFVCSGISGRSSTINSSGLLACSLASRRSSTANPVRRAKMRLNRARIATAARTGISAIRLEIGVEPPDQRAHVLLGHAVQVGEGVELVHQPFRMHPAECMPADRELAGIVAHDDRIPQEATRRHDAPQCAFGGDAHRIGRDLQIADAQTLQMGLPGTVVGKATAARGGQRLITGPASERARM